MALITCPECQTRVSEHASHCPKCGHPVKRRVSPTPPGNTDAGTSRKLLVGVLIGCLAVPLVGISLFVGGVLVIQHLDRQRISSATGPEADIPKDPAVFAVEKSGGYVEKSKTLPGKPVVFAQMRAKSDDELALLKGFDQLQTLDLSFSSIKGAGLDHLKGLRSLTVLKLSDTPIADDGLSTLASLGHIEELDLAGTKITPQAFVHLRNCKNLRTLNIRGCKSISEFDIFSLKDVVSLRYVKIDFMGGLLKNEFSKACPTIKLDPFLFVGYDTFPKQAHRFTNDLAYANWLYGSTIAVPGFGNVPINSGNISQFKAEDVGWVGKEDLGAVVSFLLSHNGKTLRLRGIIIHQDQDRFGKKGKLTFSRFFLTSSE